MKNLKVLHKKQRHISIFEIVSVLFVFTLVLFFTLCSCAAQHSTDVYVSAPCYTKGDPIRSCRILCQIDSSTGAVRWSRTFDAYQVLHCTDEDTLYIGYGANDGMICALRPEDGETLWQNDCSISWAVGSNMALADGALFYPGNYDPTTQEFPLYTLNVDTREETALPVGHMQLSDFSVYQGRIYTYGTKGITAYDLETGKASNYELPDLEYQFLHFYADQLVIAYQDRVEWYVITSLGLEQTHMITAEELNMEQMTVCAASPTAFVFLDRAVGDSWTETDLCAVTLDQRRSIVCDRVIYAPSDVVFTEKGFYASWEESITYYDWEGNQTTIWADLTLT